MQKGREKWHSNGGKLYRFGEIWRWRLKEKDSEGILGRWIMLRMGNREGETQKHVDRQQQRGGGSSYCGRGGGGGGSGGWWETRLHDVCFHGDGLSISHT